MSWGSLEDARCRPASHEPRPRAADTFSIFGCFCATSWLIVYCIVLRTSIYKEWRSEPCLVKEAGTTPDSSGTRPQGLRHCLQWSRHRACHLSQVTREGEAGSPCGDASALATPGGLGTGRRGELAGSAESTHVLGVGRCRWTCLWRPGPRRLLSVRVASAKQQLPPH